MCLTRPSGASRPVSQCDQGLPARARHTHSQQTSRRSDVETSQRLNVWLREPVEQLNCRSAQGLRVEQSGEAKHQTPPSPQKLSHLG